MPKVKVLYVEHATTVGGGERSLLELTAGLDPRRYARVFALAGDGPLAAALRRRGERVVFYHASARLLRFRRADVSPFNAGFWRLARDVVRSARSLARLLREEDPDIVHTNSQKAHWLTAAATLFSRRPVVWHMRDILRGFFLRSAADALAALAATRILAISAAVAAPFRLARAKTAVTYNAVAAPYATGRVARARLRAAWRIPPPAVVIGCVGQLAPWKGQHVFVEMAAWLALALPQAHFVIVGGPLYGAMAYEARVRRAAARGPAAGRFYFLGQVPDAAGLISAFDVLVHTPVEDEPFGRVVVEAMARGVPVVAVGRGGVPELVTDGREGLLVASADAHALAAAVARVVTRPSLAAALGAAGRATYERRFRLERLTAEVDAVYRAVVAKKDKGLAWGLDWAGAGSG